MTEQDADRTPESIAAEWLTELAADLRQFGTYAFDDKGANEVTDMWSRSKALKAMPPKRAAAVMTAILDAKGQPQEVADRLEPFVAWLICDLDTQPPEWWDAMITADQRFEDLY